jgi:hypothetical protein
MPVHLCEFDRSAEALLHPETFAARFGWRCTRRAIGRPGEMLCKEEVRNPITLDASGLPTIWGWGIAKM